jgi:hypothetical protein
MKAKLIGVLLLGAAGIWLGTAIGPSVAQNARADGDTGKVVALMNGKVEETDAKTRLEEPRFGYAGMLGTFQALGKNASGEEAQAVFVVHQHPNHERNALGCTKLKYEGPRRLGNVDGWVFKTDWDGKQYPSKVFLSAEKVYFGGGMENYIAADYRTDTGWTWKYLPLRRLELLKKNAGTDGGGQ